MSRFPLTFKILFHKIRRKTFINILQLHAPKLKNWDKLFFCLSNFHLFVDREEGDNFFPFISGHLNTFNFIFWIFYFKVSKIDETNCSFGILSFIKRFCWVGAIIGNKFGKNWHHFLLKKIQIFLIAFENSASLKPSSVFLTPCKMP